jgi:acyl-CoA thioesterase
MTVTSVGPGRATVTMTVRPDMNNGHGVCHGGVLFTLADQAMSYACNSYNQRTMAVGADINFVRPGQVGATLTATATEVTQQGRSGVYDATIVDQDGGLIAVFRGRVRRVGGEIVEN